jgi:WD40 repeat protein
MLSSAAAAEKAPPQEQMSVYPLHGAPLAADISPDENYVATQVTDLEPTADSSEVKASQRIELWDFRQNQLLAQVVLAQAQGSRRSFDRSVSDVPFVKFTHDGKFVIVYLLSNVLYVLDAHDLHLVRTIALNAPEEVTRTFTYRSKIHSVIDRPTLLVMEPSPNSHQLALLWTRERDFSQVQIYDSGSGEEVSQWNPRDHGISFAQPHTMTWESDGRSLVLAVPHSYPCSSLDKEPDVFELDTVSGLIHSSVCTGLLIGQIAVTRNAKVWVVDSAEMGVFTHHDPKLKVFDLHTGKRLKELEGRGTGIRLRVSASRSGNRVAAFTGKMKVVFDWLDMTSWPQTVDSTFSVWDATDYTGLVTSDPIPLRSHPAVIAQRPPNPPLSISARGNLVLFLGRIYELPKEKRTSESAAR